MKYLPVFLKVHILGGLDTTRMNKQTKLYYLGDLIVYFKMFKLVLFYHLLKKKIWRMLV